MRTYLMSFVTAMTVIIAVLALLAGGPAPQLAAEASSSKVWAAQFATAVARDPILTQEFSPAAGAVLDPGEAERWLWRWTGIRAGAGPGACREASRGLVIVWSSVGELLDEDGVITDQTDSATTELWREMGQAARLAADAVDSCANGASGPKQSDELR